jgi:hypothetical protein
MSQRATALLALALALPACSKDEEPKPTPVTTLPGHQNLPEDTSPKNGPRLVPPETYIRTYLHLFGGLAPKEAQAALRAKDQNALFDTWNDYLSSLGFPDYRVDIPRAGQTNTLMLATFERLGIALCDRSLEHDLVGTPPPVDQRYVFAFDPGTGSPDVASFTPRFDVLHRTFLGYPAALGPAERTSRFFDLYTSTVAAHSAAGAPASRFTPDQAGWAAVCYALVRHPEFQLY